jgi:glycosyltransferase involved in cell wall biosynthesis
VLHETRLHHARGHALLSRNHRVAYRAEFAWNHPDAPESAAELAVAGFDGTFYYRWPMVRSVLAASRHVVAHSPGAAEEIRAAWPDYPIGHVALGEGSDARPTTEGRRQRRAELGVSDDAVLFGVFGGLTEEKRIRQVLSAFASTLQRLPDARLALCGAADASLDLDREIDRAGVRQAVILGGTLDARDFDRTIAASDVTLNLRWPSAGEVSGPWLRALSAGRATVIVDLQQHGPMPTLDPRSMHLLAPAPTRPTQPVAVAVDILDELHSLRLAMRRLGEMKTVRAAIGEAGRAWWESHHTMAHMVRDYEAAFEVAVSAPEPTESLPASLRPDPVAAAAAIAGAIDERAAARVNDLCRLS